MLKPGILSDEEIRKSYNEFCHKCEDWGNCIPTRCYEAKRLIAQNQRDKDYKEMQEQIRNVFEAMRVTYDKHGVPEVYPSQETMQALQLEE